MHEYCHFMFISSDGSILIIQNKEHFVCQNDPVPKDYHVYLFQFGNRVDY